MNLEQAKKERFQRCTPGELRGFCKELNMKIGPNTSADTMVKKLLEALGLTDNVHADTVRQNVVRFKARGDVTPPYNLTFESIWEGRRRRIKMTRPADAAKGDGAIPISVNGKNTYYVPFNKVDAVPYPIYERLKVLRQVNKIETTMADGSVTTEFDHSQEKYNFADLGDDPDTADRAKDLGDWYRLKGPAWLREQSLLNMRSIASICQIEMRVKNEAGTGTRMMNEDELRQTLFLHFYSELDVEVDEAESA